MPTEYRVTATALEPFSVLRPRPWRFSLKKQRKFFIGDRPRIGTCSDAVWLPDGSLVVANVAGRALHVYDYRDPQLLLRQTVRSEWKLSGVAVSPSGAHLAVTYANGGRVALFALDGSGRVSSGAAVTSEVLGDESVHSCEFSPDGRFLVVTQFTELNSLLVLDAATLAVVHAMPNPFRTPDVRDAKAICFSRDARYAFVGYASKASGAAETTRSTIAAHAYSADTGMLSEPLASLSYDDRNIEAIDVRSDGPMLAVDQYANCMLEVRFDPTRCQLTSREISLDSAGGYVFPHGIAIRADGVIAVTDHGQDAVRVLVPTGVPSTFAAPQPGRICLFTPEGADLADGGGISHREAASVVLNDACEDRVTGLRWQR